MGKRPVPTTEQQALRDGDPAAWESLYRRMYPMMLGYAQRRMQGLDEAQDAVAEAMSRAVSSVGRMVDSGSSPDAWCVGILRHVVADAHRKHYRRAKVALPHPLPSHDPSDSLVLADDHNEIRACFDRLAPKDREVLELRVIAGLSSDEVATVLGMRRGAVRMAQSRALQRLRDLVADIDASEGRTP